MLNGTLLHAEPAIFGPGLIVFAAFLSLWIADRRQRYMLWWGLASVCLSLSAVFLPVDRPVELTLPVWTMLMGFGFAGAGLLSWWAGLEAYCNRRTAVSRLLLYWLVLASLQFVLEAVGRGLGLLWFDLVNLSVCALIARRLAPLGAWERVGGLLLLARAVNGNWLIFLLPGYTLLERVTANQLFGLGVGIALLCAGFLRAVRELESYRVDLEGAVVARTAQLEAANTELEAFSYSVSHDLRAPLRGLDGFSLALLEDYSAWLDAAGVAHLERIRAGAQRMSSLIDALIELSRLARRPLEREPVDLAVLASESLARLQAAEPARRVEARIAPGLRVECDAALLAQLLDQLLSNAWKFSARTAQARIEVGNFQHGAERVFFVRDNGIGFDPAQAAGLFTVFNRLHAAQGFAGNGMGLALAQRIVQRHGGRIWAESTAGAGASFLFTLPGPAQQP